jgi:glucosamine-6-phosphate deaminase
LSITPEQLREWVMIPPEDLAARSTIPLTIVPSPGDVYRQFAADLLAEIVDARQAGQRRAVIVPVGPTGQYPLLADALNADDVALDHMTFVGMDDWLDWQGRPLRPGHPFNLESTFRRLLIDRLRPALRPAPDQIVFPSPFDLRHASAVLSGFGGASTTYGGFGFQGHIAFNEPPSTRLSPVSLEQLRQSETRIVRLAVDTLIAHAQRSLGGNVFGVPPLGITLGMRDLLEAGRVRLYTETGSWKQSILRILLFAEPTVDYPVTLVREHPDVAVVVDAASAASPSAEW